MTRHLKMVVKIGIVTILVVLSMSRAAPPGCTGGSMCTDLRKQELRLQIRKCLTKSVMNDCCATCIKAEQRCKNEGKTKRFAFHDWKYGCNITPYHSALQYDLCQNKIIDDTCCLSCAMDVPNPCFDLTDEKIYHFGDWKFGCSDILKSSSFKAKVCTHPLFRRFCCQSCKAKSRCDDLKLKARFQINNSGKYSCDWNNTDSQVRSSTCKNAKIKAICCKTCRDSS